MKIPLSKVERLKQQSLLDWFRDHKHELSYAQNEFYMSIKKQQAENRPITDRQIDVLNSIKDALTPGRGKELIIRQNY